MRVYDRFELPPDKAELHRRAVRLQWWTIGFFVLAIALLALTLGQSQAMKAAWIEDMLALVPPAAFLIAARFRNRRPDDRFPYGYHRSVSIAFLAGSVALLGLGGYVVYDSLTRLVARERPPIGLIEVFGHRVWLGWLMIAALVVTMVPAILLGRAKKRIAHQLHDKVLYADAEMNRADWLTAGAAILGVLGIGAGLWWADAVAALVIGGDIVRDGTRTSRSAVANLMDNRPRVVDGSRPHPLHDRLLAAVRDHDWVADAWLRLREEGHVFVGELLVVPVPGTDRLVERLEGLGAFARDFDWRMHDLVVAPVSRIDSAVDGHGPPGVADGLPYPQAGASAVPHVTA
ncbi:cation diffusion facilitator family transporter [Micromonospora fluostatini]|uniref:Cation diffusion facilitator family transporter n=1 Tax=Micromonospora fluostatini TaxID=1629071 RepID=A0ABY2DG93_9ACTN|nr:cation diffusion facilitator family transporter [Micromonospora fluostatini]